MDVGRSITDAELGAVQGVVVRDGNGLCIWRRVFGQSRRESGVIREYTQQLELNRTRRLAASGQGKPLIVHPTGLTWHKDWGTFLGDTVKSADPTRSRGW